MPFQLVGTALMIFVKSELTSVIRNVEATTRKVGSTLRALAPHIHRFLTFADGNARDVREQRGRSDPAAVPRHEFLFYHGAFGSRSFEHGRKEFRLSNDRESTPFPEGQVNREPPVSKPFHFDEPAELLECDEKCGLVGGYQLPDRS